MSAPRLRYAPSPTGDLHIGGARTALFNWAYARRHGGAFVLRIEDTDRARSTQASLESILEALRWLGLDWDEGPGVGGPHAPYFQSERLARHLAYAERLIAQGDAYRCFCDPERIEALRAQQLARKESPRYDERCRALDAAEAAARAAAGEVHAVRFRVPPGVTRFVDHVRGDVTFDNAEVDDWVMVRSDGLPTYNFTCVCDDADMAISHVFRGEEHLVNTPKQVLLYQALGLVAPEFGHLPLMLGTDRKKLSKRTGDTSVLAYRDQGYPPEATVNFLALQGWALDGATEVFDVSQLVASFDVRDVGKAGSIFDIDKFRWLAGEYVRADTPAHLAERCAPFVVAAGLADAAQLERRADWFRRVVASEQERITLYADLPPRIDYLFAPDDAVVYEEAAEAGARKHPERSATLEAYRAWLAPRLETDTPPELREATRAWLGERGQKLPQLFQPLRCALSGKAGGPDLFDVMALLGPVSTLARIECARQRLA